MSERPIAVDGLRPGRVERPADEEAVARLLAAADRAGEAVVPVGGGRLLGMGGRLERFDLALDLTGMAEVLEQSQADLTVSVQAGITLERLNEALGKSGQFLPLDPAGGPGHTIGGLLATGISGPLRLRYGSARDFLIGLRVALPGGQLATSGGRVVKNVSGYDMNKLHLGALGTLGVIVAATFKVFPRPLHEVTVQAAWDRDTLEDRLRAALDLPQPPVAVEVTSDARVVVRLSGTEAAVKHVARELGWDEAPADTWERFSTRTSERWARVSVPPRALPGLVRQMPAGADWQASAHGAVSWFDFDPDAVLAVRRAAEAAGGSLVLLRAPTEVKDDVDAWGTRPATLDVMRRLRDAFDEHRTLSPGRYVV